MSGDWESLQETQMELHVVVQVAKPIEQMLFLLITKVDEHLSNQVPSNKSKFVSLLH
jgi:hypothetical protein